MIPVCESRPCPAWCWDAGCRGSGGIKRRFGIALACRQCAAL